MKIIGLAGRAGVGKDTACDFILEWCAGSYYAKRFAFADKLKESAAAALGFEGDTTACVDFCNNLKAGGSIVRVGTPEDGHGYTITGRQFLQFYGTEAHRGVFGDNFWVDALMNDLPHDAPDNHIAIITDVRFDNEADAIKRRGGVIWQIERPGSEGADDEHSSESPIMGDYVDLVVNSAGTLEELNDTLVAACEIELA